MPDQTPLPDQPDGIEDDSRDLPNPTCAAERVGEYIKASGDGLYDVQDGNPLYARDLEALTRVPAKLADVQEDLARTIDEADQLRLELDTTRTEADRAIALLRQVRDHVGEHGQGEIDVWSLRELLSQKPDQDHTNCTPDLCAVVTAPVPGSSRRVPEAAGDLAEQLSQVGRELLDALQSVPLPFEANRAAYRLRLAVGGELAGERLTATKIRAAIRAGLDAYPNSLSEGMDAAAVAVARLLDQAGESQASAPEPADADLMLESAWGVIANVGNPLGDWDSMPQQWREAAVEWARGYHAWLDGRRVAGESQASEPAERERIASWLLSLASDRVAIDVWKERHSVPGKYAGMALRGVAADLTGGEPIAGLDDAATAAPKLAQGGSVNLGPSRREALFGKRKIDLDDRRG